MELQERLKLAQEAGPRYSEIASMFEAAITTDESGLRHFRNHESASVRFAAYVNPLTVPSLSDIDSNPLIKYAAIHNPSTSTEILDHIGLNKTAVNPVIPEVIHTHKNASKEFQVFRALTDFGIQDDMYEDENEKFFYEAIYDHFNDIKTTIDLDCLQALFYLYILNQIEAPDETGEFWRNLYEILESDSKNLSSLISMFSALPAIPSKLYDCGSVTRARCLAAEMSHDASELENLVWDATTVSTGVGGFYWLDSTSPRSSVAWNPTASSEVLRRLFLEESQNEQSLKDYPAAVLWRLAGNQNSPQEVLEGIVALIESNAITEEYAQTCLLVGEPDDMNTGLAWNHAVTGELRDRVESLMRDRNLSPEEYA
jgi:hypothetical protein